MMLLCGACWLGSGVLLEAQVRALEPAPYPESTFVDIEQSYVFENAHKEIHYFCSDDTAFAIERFYEDSLSESCRCKSLPEPSKILGLLSTGRYFAGAVYLRTFPRNERCDGETLFSFEYVWAK